eukprot:scaffold378_cov270-Chaetoceros_neogracile.AAC.39
MELHSKTNMETCNNGNTERSGGKMKQRLGWGCSLCVGKSPITKAVRIPPSFLQHSCILNHSLGQRTA